MKHESIAFIGQKGIPKEFPGTSGIEWYVEKKAVALKKQGNSITCYVRQWATGASGQPSLKGIQRIVLPSINTKYFDTMSHSLLSTVHAISKKPSVIWYQGIGPAVFSFIPKLFGIRVYTTVHSLDWKRKKWNSFARMILIICERIAIKNADRVYVVSCALQTHYRQTYGIGTMLDKIVLHTKKRIPPHIIMKKYNLKKQSYVLFMGRFVPEKRIEWILNTAKVMKSVTFVLAGGSSHSDEYTAMLRYTAPPNACIIDYVFGNEKEELLSNCMFLVLPSALEGFPIIIQEALQYKKICVVGEFLRPEYQKNNTYMAYFRTQSYNDFKNTVLKTYENQ